MADYDVGVVSLSSPPSSGPVQQYRPAVQVRNNGVHDALASGVLRIYSAGLLIFTTELYSGTIAPGATEPALATDYWTPDSPGTYIVIADVTCPLDQVESNNHLGPTTVIITGLPPPPPPVVPYHASQHEDGAADELLADGLHGLLADPQTPLGHKTRHQAGGNDMINVDGLPGTLAQGQPIADHHESHEDGGGDELYVGKLRGELADNQPAKVHDNAKHDPNYTTVTEHNNHLTDTTAVHAVATNLEQVGHKGAINGYAGLDAGAHVPAGQLATVPDPPPDSSDALTLGNGWSRSNPVLHRVRHQAAGLDELSIAGLSGQAADPQVPVGHHVSHEPGGTDPIEGVGAHNTTHQNGGADEISIAGLAGKAADAQDPTGHHVSHEPGGSDPISGIPPTSHGMTLHSTSADVMRVRAFGGDPGYNPPVAYANHVHQGPGLVEETGIVDWDNATEHLCLTHDLALDFVDAHWIRALLRVPFAFHFGGSPEPAMFSVSLRFGKPSILPTDLILRLDFPLEQAQSNDIIGEFIVNIGWGGPFGGISVSAAAHATTATTALQEQIASDALGNVNFDDAPQQLMLTAQCADILPTCYQRYAAFILQGWVEARA